LTEPRPTPHTGGRKCSRGEIHLLTADRPAPLPVRFGAEGDLCGNARVSYTSCMSLPERIADLARQLSPEKQAEVLDFVEFLRARRASSAVAQHGSLEALHAALRASQDPPEDEPDWSPFDIEPAEMREVELDR
jgi:hypothetical protein